MATIGTILIQAANASGSITGPNAPSSVGIGGGGSSDDLKHQKKMEDLGKKNQENNEKAPKFWTAAFKKMGIQMGLAGILKQSQIFTSTVGSLFQIFGAFVDVILAPFVPLFIPAVRWLARQLPTVAKAAQWTADKLSKGVSSVWKFLTNGKIWSNIGNFFKDMADKVWDKFSPALNAIKDFFSPITDWVKDLTTGIWNGIKSWYDETLSGKRVAMGEGKLLGKIGFTFPGGGGTSSQGDDYATPPKGPPGPLSKAKGLLPFDMGTGGDGFEGPGSTMVAAAAGYAGLKAAQIGLTSVKGGSLLDTVLGPKSRPTAPTTKVGKTSNAMRRALAFTDDWEMNPVRKIPGSGLLKAGVNVPVKTAELAGKAVLASGRTLAEVMGMPGFTKAAPTTPSSFTRASSSPFSDDLGQMNQRMPKGYSQGDDLAQMKKPTQISNAVAKFNQWVKSTSGKLKGATGKGATAFQKVYDEGFKLADDVVKIAARTPGMGAVGSIVSVGFKRVIPGIAGAYMVGETIQDVWKIIKSDAPWLGDWKSLDAYKSEAMNIFFGGGKMSAVGGAGTFGASLVTGFGTSALGKIQSGLGFGDSISDWQKGIRDKAGEGGVLSSGKLMDAIIRGGTGLSGAALSTFFPGLGTLAGTALYEGGRYATTGVNIPGMGMVGGNVERYGEATDFSDTIIKAIEQGWNKGVNVVGIQ